MMQQISFIQLSPEQLEHLLQTSVEKALVNFETHFQPKKAKSLMTRQEVADYFEINLSTLHNWCKRRKLTPYGLGARVYFKREEVEGAVIKLKKQE